MHGVKDLSALNLLSLPIELLAHISSFLSTCDVVKLRSFPCHCMWRVYHVWPQFAITVRLAVRSIVMSLLKSHVDSYKNKFLFLIA